MDLLSKSKNEDLAIFRAFAKRTLQKYSAPMKKNQDKVTVTLPQSFWKQRTYVNSDISLKYSHNMMNRFFDMNRRRVGGKKVENINCILNPNKIIMGHFAGIQGENDVWIIANITMFFTFYRTRNYENHDRNKIRKTFNMFPNG